MKDLSIIHPFLFAIFPVIFLFSHNIEKVSFSEILWPIIIVLSLTFLLLLLCRIFLKNNQKASIIISIFWIFCFSYGHVLEIARDWWQIGSFVVGRHRCLLPIWSVLFICSIYFTIKTHKDLYNFVKILNGIATFLVLISLINIVAYKLETKVIWQNVENIRPDIGTPNSVKINTLPDIYYIILDRYANTSILKEIYNFDNSEFINYLINKGFYVASKSRSNYPNTAHSLASSLNMEYINYLTKKMGRKSNDWRPIYRMLQDYKVWRFLKSKGYKFIHFGSWWHPTSKNKYADINFTSYALPEFSMVLFRTTMFYPISVEFGLFEQRLEQYKRVLYKFDKLAKIPNIKEPTFVFAHFLIPHEPYVFDRNGNFVTAKEAHKRKSKKCYVEQLIFTNKKLKTLIDTLLSNSEILPIIILQADEGPYPARAAFNPNFDWRQATKTEFREKMGILNAYYLPNINKNVLYPSITPVNSFRLIFNLYFNTNFELLPDESYAYPFVDRSHLYEFFNVTDKFEED